VRKTLEANHAEWEFLEADRSSEGPGVSSDHAGAIS
jgi:hypothetical protein